MTTPHRGTWNGGGNHTIVAPHGHHAGEPYEVTIHPFFFGRRGETHTIPQVASPQLCALPGGVEEWKAARDITVYIPPGAVENTAKPCRDVLGMYANSLASHPVALREEDMSVSPSSSARRWHGLSTGTVLEAASSSSVAYDCEAAASGSLASSSSATCDRFIASTST